MRNQIFHIFRNTPRGRETLLQAKFLADGLEIPLVTWIPDEPRLNFLFGEHELIVSLDRSYLRSRETAEAEVERLLKGETLYHLFTVSSHKDRDLPNIPGNFSFISCPKVIGDHASSAFGHVGIGHVGPAARAVVRHALGPVFMPAALFRPWTQIAVLFGGSALGLKGVEIGLALAERLEMPLSVYTQPEHGQDAATCQRALEAAGLSQALETEGRTWVRWAGGRFEENLLSIPHDALLVLGAAGHNLVREVFTGSKLAAVQRDWPGPLVLVGPEARLAMAHEG